MDFRTVAVAVKRESSVSPPGWEHSSEEDQPLDFSRHSPSFNAKRKANEVDPSSKACKAAELDDEEDDREASCPRREQPNQRDLTLTLPQPLHFHHHANPSATTTTPPQTSLSPPCLQPKSNSLVGLTTDVLGSSALPQASLYGSLLFPGSLQSSSRGQQQQQQLLDPNYIIFRHQVLMQKKTQPPQRRRTLPPATPSTQLKASESATTTTASSTSTTIISEPSSELSDHSSDCHSIQGHADSTNRRSAHTTLPPESAASPTSSSSGNGNGSSNSNSRRRGKAFPDELKDEAYWERRRKNNEAAKRSRDLRRAKEDEIAIRAAFLEQENLKLRVELGALSQELHRMRTLLEGHQQ